MAISQNTPSFPEELILSKYESSSWSNRPVLWLKQPQTVCLIISALSLFLALRAEGSASSFSMKQSSLFIVFSPMHMELVKRLAVDFGSIPYSSNIKTRENCISYARYTHTFQIHSFLQNMKLKS